MARAPGIKLIPGYGEAALIICGVLAGVLVLLVGLYLLCNC
jgi:hypothetical protein